jgi:hypothetical protein
MSTFSKPVRTVNYAETLKERSSVYGTTVIPKKKKKTVEGEVKNAEE